MSKGNGRQTNIGMGNGFANFNGRANGQFSTIEERMQEENIAPRKPSALESKASNYRYPITDKNIKKFKDKIK